MTHVGWKRDAKQNRPTPNAPHQNLQDLTVGITVIKRMNTDARRRLRITRQERQSVSPEMQRFFESLKATEGPPDGQQIPFEYSQESSLLISANENTRRAPDPEGSDMEVYNSSYHHNPYGLNSSNVVSNDQGSMMDGPPPAYTPTLISPTFEQPRIYDRSHDQSIARPNRTYDVGPNGIQKGVRLDDANGANALGILSPVPSIANNNSSFTTNTTTTDSAGIMFDSWPRQQRSVSAQHASSLSPLGSMIETVRRKPISSTSSPLLNSGQASYIDEKSTGSMKSPVSKLDNSAGSANVPNQLRKVSSNVYRQVDDASNHVVPSSTLRSARSTPYLDTLSSFDNGGEPLILEAAQKGLSDVITELLMRNADIEAVSKITKRNALSEAARMGYEKVVDLLIRHGCALDPTDTSGNGAIHLAALGGHVLVMELLLNKGVPVDSRGNNNQTPLHLASGIFRPDSVRLLLRYLPEANARDSSQRTPLHKSAIRGDPKSCSLLLEYGASLTAVDNEDKTALQLASIAGHTEVVQLLLGRLNPKQNSFDVLDPFYGSVKSGNIGVVKCFLQSYVKLKKLKSSESHKPLTYAIDSGDISMVALMIDNKCSTNQKDEKGWSAMHHAAHTGNTVIVKTLMEKGLSCKAITLEKELPLHLALAADYLPTAEALLQSKDSSTSAKDAQGQECVHYAARNGSVEFMRLLLEKKASTNNENSYGWRPIHIAVAYGHLNLVQELLARGVSIEEKLGTTSYTPAKQTHTAVKNGLLAEARWPYPGTRPLHLALEYARDDIAQFLVDHGARVDERDSEGWRPLHYAAFYGSSPLVQRLLAAGAYPHATTQEGKTPLGLGFRTNQPQLSEKDRTSVQDQLNAAMLATKKNKMDSWKKGMNFWGKTVQEKNQALMSIELILNALQP